MAKKQSKKRKRKPSGARAKVLRREEFSVCREARYIVERAQHHDARVVQLGGLVLFSTDGGDAWLLDPPDKLALCLARKGEPLPYRIVETPTDFAIEWTEHYAITQDGFTIENRDGTITVLPGYPVEHIRAAEHQPGHWTQEI